MSSDRIERKRRSEFDTSDNSADEVPPVKIRKLDSSAISIGQKVSKVCKSFLNWVTPNFLKKMAVRVSHQASSSSFRMGTENNFKSQYSVDVSDDDDDEIAVVSEQNGTGARSKSSSALRTDSPSRGTWSRSSSNCPLASTPQSLPVSIDDHYYKIMERTMERRKMNGLTSATDLSRSRRSEKCSRPITNPRSKFDILLGKDNEVEIISEVYPGKQSPGPTGKTRLLSDSRSCRNASASCVGDSSRSPYSSGSYTANEVLRLQEKAHYRLLLEKVVKRGPLFKPAFPRKDSHSSTIQVDLTGDDDISDANDDLKRKNLEKDMKDFLSRYYKPYYLENAVKMESRLNNIQSVLEREISIDDDDDIQIIETPKFQIFRPKKSSDANQDFFSDAWIADLKTSMLSSTEEVLERVSKNERIVQRYKMRREAKIAEETRKRDEQRLAGIIFPEDVEMEEEELPEITPEMEAMIDRAFVTGLSEDIITDLKTAREIIDLRKKDIASLAHLNWLNDTVINFYLGLIEHRGKQDGYPSVFTFNSFFYTKLKKEGPSRALLRWTRKIDIFAHDLIMVPLHLEMHWALLIIDQRSKKITYYDSMGSGESTCLKVVENFLITEMQDKKKTILEPNTFSFEIPKDIPKQMNGSDCGMFTLKYAEYVSRDAPITFTQENMPYFRRRMVYELINKVIL